MCVIWLLCVASLGVVACSPPPSTTLRLPSGVEAPAGTDPSFVARVDSLIATGHGDRRIVCYLQYKKKDMPPKTADVEPLQKLGQDAWIIKATATAIKAFTTQPSLRFIGEYAPEYKYNHTLAGANVAWVYIEIFTDPQPQYVDEMSTLGIEDVRWDFAPRRYYAKATGGQIVDLAKSWWVKNIFRVRTRGL